MHHAPLVAMAGVAQVGVGAEVLVRELPVDPADVAVDFLLEVAPAQPAAQSEAGLEVGERLELRAAGLHPAQSVAPDRRRRLAGLDVEPGCHRAPVLVASHEVERVAEGHRGTAAVASHRPAGPTGARLEAHVE